MKGETMRILEAKAALETTKALLKRVATPGYASNGELADATRLWSEAIKDITIAIDRIDRRGLEWWDTGNKELWSGRDDICPSADDAAIFAESVILSEVSDGDDWHDLAVQCYRKAADAAYAKATQG